LEAGTEECGLGGKQGKQTDPEERAGEAEGAWKLESLDCVDWPVLMVGFIAKAEEGFER
jgi:hypothetical protein